MDCQLFYLDASSPIPTSFTKNGVTRPHQQICLNFSLYNCKTETPYQLKLAIIDERTGECREIGYTAPHVVDNPEKTIIFNLSFIVDYFFNKIQNLKIDIARGSEVAFVIVQFPTLMTSPNSTMRIPLTGSLPNEENVGISAREMELTNKEIVISMQIQGCLDPAFYVIKRTQYNPKTQQKELINVYKSESTRNGIFNDMKILSACLDQGDHTQVISFSLYIKGQLIGTRETTFSEISQNEMFNMKIGEYSMYLTAKEQEKTLVPFVELVQGRLNVNLSIGIDFTGSNGPYTDKRSLHYFNPKNKDLNLYESAIYECGKILQNYDTDKIFPVYGFGAALPSKGVSHCFPLSLDPNGNPNIQGLENIMMVYRQTLPKLTFSGPTYFRPLLEKIFGETAAAQTQQMQYSIVLILTDGMITDFNETKDLIVKSTHLPLSIIIVGVGGADFSKMEALDSDGKALVASDGTVSKRDIVQFVEFQSVNNNPQLLAEKVLEELPRQMEEYFYMYRNQQFQ